MQTPNNKKGLFFIQVSCQWLVRSELWQNIITTYQEKHEIFLEWASLSPWPSPVSDHHRQKHNVKGHGSLAREGIVTHTQEQGGRGGLWPESSHHGTREKNNNVLMCRKDHWCYGQYSKPVLAFGTERMKEYNNKDCNFCSAQVLRQVRLELYWPYRTLRSKLEYKYPTWRYLIVKECIAFEAMLGCIRLCRAM